MIVVDWEWPLFSDKALVVKGMLVDCPDMEVA
jgi:hypothetical protein